jgi:hypothetical protein
MRLNTEIIAFLVPITNTPDMIAKDVKTNFNDVNIVNTSNPVIQKKNFKNFSLSSLKGRGGGGELGS